MAGSANRSRLFPESKAMAEDVLIEAIAGPYRGQRLTVSADDAKAAIKDGWARDPFAEPEEPKEMTDEDRQKVAEAAEKAARRLRGEEETEAPKPSVEAKAVEPEQSGSYETRTSKPMTKK
jgi:hypothetical protein